MITNTILTAVAFICGAILLSKRIRSNRAWRATVTPLASIIGSGFLVIVPILGNAFGAYAPVAMFAVVCFAYMIGMVIRFNIKFAEPAIKKSSHRTLIVQLDSISDISLGFAYFISVTFYIRLLSSFTLRGLELEDGVAANTLTTLILAFIGLAGWKGGLGFLERMEQYSVSIKLAIIASLLLGWAAYDYSILDQFDVRSLVKPNLGIDQVFRLLAGVLIAVQGFETSRYLGDEYDPSLRISTMRFAQIVSGIIYVVFISLAVPTFNLLTSNVDETAIIDLSMAVAVVLPPMLVIAAIMSQFSAAVADTVGAGGMFAQTIGKRFKRPERVGYLIVAFVGIALVWTTDIFQIISLASRAFAIYYAFQCVVAMSTAWQSFAGIKRAGLVFGFGLLTFALVLGAMMAIPAG